MPTRRDLAERAAQGPRGRSPHRRRARRRRRRSGVPGRRDPRPGLDRGVLGRRGHDRRRAVADLGGQPGARCPVGQHPGPVRRPSPRRGRRLHGPGDQPPGADVRHGPHDLRGCGRSRCRGGHPRAGPQRTDLHVPAPDRLRNQRVWPARSLPAGEDRSSSRATTTSSTRRSTPADPEAMTEEIRRACRLAVDAGYRNIDIDSLDAGRPVEADGRRAAARELPAARPS